MRDTVNYCVDMGRSKVMCLHVTFLAERHLAEVYVTPLRTTCNVVIMLYCTFECRYIFNSIFGI